MIQNYCHLMHLSLESFFYLLLALSFLFSCLTNYFDDAFRTWQQYVKQPFFQHQTLLKTFENLKNVAENFCYTQTRKKTWKPNVSYLEYFYRCRLLKFKSNNQLSTMTLQNFHLFEKKLFVVLWIKNKFLIDIFFDQFFKCPQ